jgi:purine-binding chemotaxis protein CheW
MLVHAIRSLGAQKITPVPSAPRFYRGVVNLRGQIITVLDIRRFFELPEATSEPPRELVVVRSNALELGLIARHVQGVQRIPAESVRPFEQLRYARGVTAERLVILDIARLFEDDRLVIKHAEE